MNLILGKNSVETCFHHCLRASLIASALLLLACRARADGYIHSESNDNIARRQANQAWMDEHSWGHSPTVEIPPWQRDIANAKAKADAYSLQLNAQIAEREARIAADKARERAEAANRRALEAEFAQEAAQRAARDQELEQQPWKDEQVQAKENGRVLTLGFEEYKRYKQQLKDWDAQAPTDRHAALMYGLANLNGPYGMTPNVTVAEIIFSRHGYGYWAGLCNYRRTYDPAGMTSLAPDRLKHFMATSRIVAKVLWDEALANPAKETDPAAQKRTAVCLLALQLSEPRESQLPEAMQREITTLIHRALAAQHAAIRAHPRASATDQRQPHRR
jgi:hypothetical protein